MRIALLVDVYLPFVSGVTYAVSLLAGELRRKGHEVHIFTSGTASTGTVSEHVHRVPGISLGRSGYTVAPSFPPDAQTKLRTMDVIHVHHPFGMGRLALRYAGDRAVPLIYTQHTRYDLYAKYYFPWPLSRLGPGLARRYLRRFCKRMDAVLAPTMSLKSLLRGWGIEPEAEIVPNGIDLDWIRTATPVSRTSLGLPEASPILVFVGRLGSEKNLDFLLRAFARLATLDRRPHLLLIGDGRERRKLEAFGAGAGIRDRVHFTGWVERSQIPAYLAHGFASVTASLTEVHPLTLLEAFGAGLPVVALRAPGVEDIVIHQENGLLCVPDEDALVGSLRQLLSDPTTRERLALGAKVSAEGYSIERTAERTLEVYRRCRGERRTKRASLAAAR
ncbi:MAG: glycosyltransferase [Anaerolineales bacterium]